MGAVQQRASTRSVKNTTINKFTRASAKCARLCQQTAKDFADVVVALKAAVLFQTSLAESERMKPGAEGGQSDARRQASPREGRARRQTTCAIASVALMTYQENTDEAQKRVSDLTRDNDTSRRRHRHLSIAFAHCNKDDLIADAEHSRRSSTRHRQARPRSMHNITTSVRHLVMSREITNN